MTSPSRPSRESTTRSSPPPQNGHFMRGGTRESGLGTRIPPDHSLLDSAERPPFSLLWTSGSRFGDVAQVHRTEGEEEKADADDGDKDARGGPGDQRDGGGCR